MPLRRKRGGPNISKAAGRQIGSALLVRSERQACGQAGCDHWQRTSRQWARGTGSDFGVVWVNRAGAPVLLESAANSAT
jgi:hypothetical protein